MLEVCCGVTNGREKDGGTRGPVRLWSEGLRVTELRYVLSVRAYALYNFRVSKVTEGVSI